MKNVHIHPLLLYAFNVWYIGTGATASLLTVVVWLWHWL